MTLMMIMSSRVVIASKRGIEENQSGTRARLCVSTPMAHMISNMTMVM